MATTFKLPNDTMWFEFVAPDMESGVSYYTTYRLIRKTADVNRVLELRREADRTKKVYEKSPVTDETYQAWKVASSRLFYAERELAGTGYARESEDSAGNFDLWWKNNRTAMV